jgi:hypothetical protein
VDEHCADADRFGGAKRAKDGVGQHIGSNAFALPTPIDGEPTEQYDGRWIRHVTPDLASCDLVQNRTGGEAVVANDARADASNEGA